MNPSKERSAFILNYWFGEIKNDSAYVTERVKFWFEPSQATDLFIRQEFEENLLRSIEGKLDSWKETAKGSLALILLWDQFPRHMYRASPRAFAYDMLAQNLCLKGLREQIDRTLHPLERVFFYMPLEHAEDVELQKKSVECFKYLVGEAPPELRDVMKNFLDYAIRHLEIIEKFLRFPHRNLVLNRPSTAAELEFLKQPGASF